MFAEAPIEVGMLTPEVVRSIVREAQNAIGRETRKLNKTGATKRTGKHRRLDPDAKAAREAARRVRKAKREEAKETIAEAAKIRWARRRAEEDERAARRRLRIHVPKEKEPKVTAAGGRKYARSYQRFERQVLPMLPARMPVGSTALVFRIKSRRLGGLGKSRWRKSELANFLRYLTRLQSLAAEPEAAVFTNISQHEPGTDAFARELAAFGQVVENLEGAIDPNGQVYHSGVIPLPWEIGSEAHCRIAHTVQQAFAKRGLACIVVVHAPDPGSDRRNVHLHIAVVTRAFIQHGERDWSFAPTRSRDVFHPTMMTVWRRYLVGVFNRELAMSERRYTLDAADAPAQHLGRVSVAEGRRRLLAAQARHEIAVSEEASCFSIKGMADEVVRSATRLRAAGGEIARLALIKRKAALARHADTLGGLVQRSDEVRMVADRLAHRKTTERLRTRLRLHQEHVGKTLQDLAFQAKVARLVRLQRSLATQATRATTLVARSGEARRHVRVVRALSSSRDAMRALQSRVSAVSARLDVLRVRSVRDQRLRDLRTSLAPRRSSVAAAKRRIERLATYVSAYPGLARTRELLSTHRGRLDIGTAQLASIAARARGADRNLRKVETDDSVERSRIAVAEVPRPTDALHSFDKAAAAMASSCSADFELLLASARLAMLERRLIVRRCEDGIELIAADQSALVVACDLAARRFGRRVLREAAQQCEIPAGWHSARILAVTNADRGDERLLRLARETALARSPLAKRESLIHGRIERAVQAGLLKTDQARALKASVSRNGLFFTARLRTELGGARLTLAAADRQVLSILTALLKNADGVAVLVDLARRDALGDYPAPGDWAEHKVRLQALAQAREEPSRELPQPVDNAPDRGSESRTIQDSAPDEDQSRLIDSFAEPDTGEDLGVDVLSAAYAAKVNQRS